MIILYYFQQSNEKKNIVPVYDTVMEGVRERIKERLSGKNMT